MGVALGAIVLFGRATFPWEGRCGGKIGGPPSGDDTFGVEDGTCCGGSCIWKGCAGADAAPLLYPRGRFVYSPGGVLRPGG